MIEMSRINDPFRSVRYGVIDLGMHKIDLLEDDCGSESEASAFRPVRNSSRGLVYSHSKVQGSDYWPAFQGCT